MLSFFFFDHKSHLVQLVIMKNVSMELLRVIKIFKTTARRICSKHKKFEVKVESRFLYSVNNNNKKSHRQSMNKFAICPEIIHCIWRSHICALLCWREVCSKGTDFSPGRSCCHFWLQLFYVSYYCHAKSLPPINNELFLWSLEKTFERF